MSCVLTNYTSMTTTPIPCNPINGSANLFTGQVQYTDYGYEPNHAATYAFLAIFASGFAAHVLLGVWQRCWWTLPTLAVGTAVEVIGWGGRLWSIVSWRWDPNQGGLWSSNHNGFIVQIVCLVIGPTFFSAANYILLGSPSYVSLHSQSFSLLFICADLTCLVVQAVGGGIAGTANNEEGANQGGYIMTGGVILQLIVTVIYLILFGEWVYRRHTDLPSKRQYNPFSFTSRFARKKHAPSNIEDSNNHMMSPMTNGSQETHATTKPEDGLIAPPPFRSEFQISEKRIQIMCALIAMGTLLIIIRSVYRSIELLRGWSGPVATDEPLFIGMDALLMCLFVWLYAAVHPYIAFGRRLF
ncbi:hypothetical protein IAR55_005611 [Kwoniella newhampshirensis]|uniref:Uncharacterized protein n=1 Tax=Kwoniella newhampshirensis TaxID=1651941 RepID=A0AAW0YV36_9TREE